jgi:WD40 repeat protein
MWRVMLVSALLIAAVVNAQTLPPPVTESHTLSTPSEVTSLVIAKNGQSIVGVCKDGQLRRWSLPQGQLLRTFGEVGSIYMLVTSEDGRWVLAGNNGGEVTAWDGTSGDRIFHTQLSRYPGSGFVPVSTNPSGFSHAAKYLALSAAGDAVQVLEWPSGRKLYSLESPLGGTSAIAFSRDDSRIASADNDGRIRVYDTFTGKLLSHYDDFLTEPFALDFAADGRQVVAAGADKQVVFVDASSGKVVRHLERFPDPVAYVEVSPDGKKVAVALAKAESQSLPASVSVWDTLSAKKATEWTPPSHAIGATWTPDGHWLLATSTGDAVHLWRIY